MNRRLTTRLLLVVLGVLAALSTIVWGRDPLAAGDVIAVLRGQDVPGVSFLLLEDRLPRIVIGALAGAGLGASGSLFQRWLKNPLASPDVIGVGYGAAAAAVAYLVIAGTADGLMPLAALAGGLAVAAVIYLLAGSGASAGAKLIVSGVAIGAMLQALIHYLLTRAAIRTASDALHWLTGSLATSTWPRAALLAAGLGVIGVTLLPVVRRQLTILELGDAAAAALGLNVSRARALLVFVAVALSAIPIAVTGPIAFVAFLAGPISAALTGRGIRIGAAALTGACLVLVANALAMNLLPHTSLPVGVVTGALGAPALILVLLRHHSPGK